jgi:PDZ domain-containing protein
VRTEPGLSYRRRRPPRRVIVAVVVAILAASALVVPVPLFYLLVPGPVQDVGRRIEVSGARSYSSEGRLYLTTVEVDVSATVAEMIRAGFNATTIVVTAAQVTGGRSLDQLERVQRTEMVESKQHARAVALGAAGFGRPTGRGARVVSTTRGSPADGVLHEGDVITAVNDSRVATSCDAGRAVDAADAGDQLTVTVLRRARPLKVTLRATRAGHTWEWASRTSTTALIPRSRSPFRRERLPAPRRD